MNISSDSDISFRKQLVSNLKGGQAFSPIDRVVEKVSFENIGIIPDGLPYSFYQQFYHIWYAQHDIIEYCQNEDYKAPTWPDEYWPGKTEPAQESDWNELVKMYFEDRKELESFILDDSNNLFEPVPTNPDHTLFREIQLVIEHTAYHTGQLYVIARLLDAIQN